MITGFAYAYDRGGSRTSVLEAGGDRVTWTYDDANRLTREQRSGASAEEDEAGFSTEQRGVPEPPFRLREWRVRTLHDPLPEHGHVP